MDGLGYTVKLENGDTVDVLIDQNAIAILALTAHRNKTGRAVGGPCKAVLRRAKR